MLSITDVRQFFLGVQGENEEQTITIDVKPWLVQYPNGAISIYHKRNGESVPSPVTTVFDAEEGTISWTPTYTDTYVQGDGEAEIRLYENGVIKKTRTVITNVAKSVTGAGGVTLESGWQGYITYVESLKNAATAAKADAEAAEAAAEAYAAITAHPPLIDDVTGDWLIWDADEGEYVDSGEPGRGVDGVSPSISVSTITGGHSVSITDRSGTETFNVMDGADGADGTDGQDGTDGRDATIYIRYSNTQPTSDSDMKTTPDDWMGIYAGYATTAPTHYTDYVWYKVKGADGSPAAGVYGNTIDMTSTDSTKVATAINGKASKVNSATSGNFAALDSNGDLTDSGHKHSDYLTEHQDISGKLDKPSTAGTSGQVLTSDGAGGQSWQTPSGGTVTDVQEDGTSILSSGVANILTMTGAGSSAAGTKGLVPAPAAGDQGKILMGDGTWSNDIPNRLAAVENVYEDQDISIQTTDWVNGVYTWTSNLVTAECGYEVFLRAGAENAGIETFDDAKVTGGIQFTIVSGMPIAALPLTVRIIKAKADSIVTLTGSDIGTDVITGCDNVDEALDALDDAIATNSDHIANIGTHTKSTYTGTTSNGGNIVTDIPYVNGAIITAVTSGNYVVIPYKAEATGVIVFHVMDTALTPVTNASLTITYGILA